jgi:hypothetical protein
MLVSRPAIAGNDPADAKANDQESKARRKSLIDVHGQNVVMLQRVMMRPWAVGERAGS